MKILFVNCVYGFGSTGKIISDLMHGLKVNNIASVVCYGRGAQSADNNIIKLIPDWQMRLQSIAGKITGFVYDCSPWSTKALKQVIKREQPDVVNLHCINANTVNMAGIITYLKTNGIKTLLTFHSEFHFTGGCGYALDCNKWISGCNKCPQFHIHDSNLPRSFFFDRTKSQWEKMYKAYNGFNDLRITCVSPWLTERVRRSPFFNPHNVTTVTNGLNTSVFCPRDSSRLKDKHNLGNGKVILHVTPNFYSAIKGGGHVLEIAGRLKKEHPDWKIIIVGYNGTGDDLPDNVIGIRFTRDQEELAEYYSLADITLLTSRKETFSMICAETLCCGTPIVGFEAGGPETISMTGHSSFVEYGNTGLLYETLVSMINHKHESPVNIDEAHSLYSIENMTDGYMEMYRILCGNETPE